MKEGGVMARVQVCDAIMGSGKTEAAITHISEHTEQRFIYVSPYCSEDERINKACKGPKMCIPQQWKQYEWSKLKYTKHLLEEGRNIASTHQALRRYTDEMLELVHKKRYDLIIDENLDALESVNCDAGDMEVLMKSGCIKYLEEGSPVIGPNEEVPYTGKVFTEFFDALKEREAIAIRNRNGGTVYYWMFPPKVLNAFDTVIILTYMFEGQGLHYCLKMNGIPYEKIGVCRDEDGVYRFGPPGGYVPDYVHHLRSMIRIADYRDINEIGDDRYALSVNWFETGVSEDPGRLDQLRRNIQNFLRKHTKSTKNTRMWSVPGDYQKAIQGGGYTNGFVPFNTKASNDYRDRTALAYCVNVFMHVGQKNFYKNAGLEINDDVYAKSVMVQWIWRSAIRDGHPIDLYLPSSRMRKILCGWIDDLSKM